MIFIVDLGVGGKLSDNFLVVGVGIGVDVAFGAKGLLPDITLNIIKPADMNTINVATIIATINAVLLLFFFECLLPFVFLEKSFLIPFNCFCDCILFPQLPNVPWHLDANYQLNRCYGSIDRHTLCHLGLDR